MLRPAFITHPFSSNRVQILGGDIEELIHCPAGTDGIAQTDALEHVVMCFDRLALCPHQFAGDQKTRPKCGFDRTDQGSQHDVMAGRDHPGMGQFLYADGSVQLLMDQIDPATYRALSTIAGSELVNPP